MIEPQISIVRNRIDGVPTRQELLRLLCDIVPELAEEFRAILTRKITDSGAWHEGAIEPSVSYQKDIECRLGHDNSA
ncbi:MAG: hypothetical protein ACREPR_26345 [Brasilonema sp.]